MRQSHLSFSGMAPSTAPSEEFSQSGEICHWKQIDSKRAKEKGGVLGAASLPVHLYHGLRVLNGFTGQSIVFSNMQSTIFLVRLFNISILVKNVWVTNRAVQYNYSAGSGCSRTVILYC